MTGYDWQLTCDEGHRAGWALTIAEGLADLRSVLHQWAATTAGDEVEGCITGAVGDAPFWIGWGPLGAARGGTDRAGDVAEDIDQLVEDVRAHLHRLERTSTPRSPTGPTPARVVW